MTIRYFASKESIEQINEFFTKQYDYKQWFFRLKTYDLLLGDSNLERFVNESNDDELKNEDLDRYKLALKSEIVFNFFHMTEALFSLMYACRRSPVPWIEMKSTRFKELCKYVNEEIVSGKISDEDIRFLFYNGVIGEEAKKEIVVKSIQFINEFLKRTGELFLEYGEIYNEYKHGLRLMTARSYISMTPEDMPDPKPILQLQGDAHIFLTTKLVKKEGNDEIHQIQQNTVTFDYKRYLRLSIYIYRLISDLFNTRRQKEKLKPGEPIEVGTFASEDLKEIFREDPGSKFKFSVTYPG